MLFKNTLHVDEDKISDTTYTLIFYVFYNVQHEIVTLQSFGLNLFRGKNSIEQVFPFPEGKRVKPDHSKNSKEKLFDVFNKF